MLTADRNTLLMSCRVPFYRNLYVIGTLARRVSFATQQRRAFNLPMAIDEEMRSLGDREGLTGKHVAIIGAGLAGMTAQVAFGALGAHTHLIEKSNNELEHFNHAEHRFVHPSLNFWPAEPLAITTPFPGLNWALSSCCNVAEQVRLSRHFLNRGDSRLPELGILEGREVREIRQVNVGKFQLAYRYTAPAVTDSEADLADYEFERVPGLRGTTKDLDVVVVCTGFGDDGFKDPMGSGFITSPYWLSGFDALYARRGLDAYKHVVVSGTGDGGLIETIRFLWGRYVEDPEFQTAIEDILHDDWLTDRVRNIEFIAAQKNFDVEMHISDPAERKERLRKNNRELAKEYNGLWDFLINRRNGPVFDRLVALRQKWCASDIGKSCPPVTLVGRTPTPYELGVAPIHKLLIAFAQHMGVAHKDVWFEYLEVESGWDEKGVMTPTTPCPDGLGRDGLPNAQDITFTLVPKSEGDEYDDPVVVRRPGSLLYARHGAHPDLSIFKTLAEYESVESRRALSTNLRRLQRLYADTDTLDAQAVKDYVKRLYSSQNRKRGREAHANFYSAAAHKMFSQRYGKGVAIRDGEFLIYDLGQSSPVLSEDAFSCRVGEPFLPRALMPARLPSHAFAVPVKEGDRPVDLEDLNV